MVDESGSSNEGVGASCEEGDGDELGAIEEAIAGVVAGEASEASEANATLLLRCKRCDDGRLEKIRLTPEIPGRRTV